MSSAKSATGTTQKESKVSTVTITGEGIKSPLLIGYTGTNFSALIGEAIKAANNKAFTFALFGCSVTVPAGNKTPQQQFIFAVEVLVKTIFAGMEADETPKDAAKLEFCKSLQQWFKFSHLTKSAILQAIKVKKDRIAQLTGLQKDATNNLNKAFIADTETVKQARKIVKEQGNEAARLFLQSKKVAGLPQMLKAD